MMLEANTWPVLKCRMLTFDITSMLDVEVGML